MTLATLKQFTEQFSQQMCLPANEDEERLKILLSQVYQEWERQTQLAGAQQAQQTSITCILATRFGAIDDRLAAIVPAIMALPIESATPLLLQLSREELLNHFLN
jgi:Tfp pilus assembly PilM family ATPase